MKHDSSTVSWNQLGEEFIELAQKDESRISFIMPYTLKLIGDVSGKRILDLGCGEGGYSRELAKRGANIVAVDCSAYFINYAKSQAELNHLNIEHFNRNSNHLYGLASEYFDIVLCSMMLMDCEDLHGTLKEVERVLKPTGKFFISILHPCSNGNYEEGIGRQGQGIDRKAVVKNYFYPEKWEAPLPKGETPVIWRHRPLEEYVKAFLKHGFSIVDLNEPRPTKEQANISAAMAWLQKIPLFLFFELRK